MSVPGVGQLLGLVGESAGIVAVRETLRRLLPRLADTSRPPALLIQGETGTGKGLLARAIHRASRRHEGPFVDVNCAAIPETLLEAELFGYERGAFTDARQAKPGLFQAASRGTLFLDELGLLTPALQGKLLTVLEDRMVRRLGSTRGEPVDVWILAATSSDLDTAMRAGRFHDALYHRLTVLKLWLPPLRERGADIALLADHFLARACRDHGLPPKRLQESARAALLAYGWPGNVRELANVMERVALLGDGTAVTAEMLDLGPLPTAAPAPGGSGPAPAGHARDARHLRDRVAGLERDEIAEALRQVRGNVTHAAARLGVPPNTLRYRIQKHGLSRRAAGPGPAPATPRASRRSASAAAPGSGAATGSGAIRWETRRVAALQVSLATEDGAAAPPDAARAVQILLDKVASFGGRVEEQAPTGLVAAFGIEPIEDAPRRAALAARAILAALHRAREEAASPWSARLGLHVDAFLVGQAGHAAPVLDLSAKRRTLAILDALAEAAEPGGVLASAEAARFLDRRFDLAAAGTADGVGPVWRLGSGERAGPGPRAELTRFAGRGEELGVLRARAAEATAGRGQAVAISGEPGIGKSRLLFELRRHVESEGWRYLEGRCVPHGRPVPYVPFADVIRQLCDIADGDTAEVLVDKVRRGIAALGLDPRERLPFALAVLGIAAGGEPAPLAPQAITARIAETVRQLLVAASWQRPLALAIEDLHWSDPDSEALLSALGGALAAAPLLLVATYRAGHPPPWPAGGAAVEVALEPLSSEASRSVLQSALGPTQVPDALAALIEDRADGNPFFLEELARAVVENPAAAGAVPVTVQEVLRDRIQRLPEQDRRLLQRAAVLGKDVPLVLLEAVSDLDAEPLAAGLQRLGAAQFLRDGALPLEPGYAFKHALTQEVAYSTLGADERRQGHRRAIAAIESVYAGRLEEHRDQLAHHVVRGEMWGKALSYLRPGPGLDAGSGPPAVSGFAAGASLWVAGHHARAVQRAQVESQPTAIFMNFNGQVHVHLNLGQAYHSMGAYRRAIEILARNARMLEGNLRLHRVENWPTLPAVLTLAWLASSHAQLGELPQADARASEAIGVAEAAGDPYGRALAGWAQGTVALLKGDAAAAAAALERARRLGEDAARELGPLVESALGLALAQRGQAAEGAAMIAEAVRAADAAGLAADQSLRVVWHAEAERLAGRLDAADELAERGVTLARARGERGHEAHGLLALAALAGARGGADSRRVEECYRRAMELAEELEMRLLVARGRAGLAELRGRGD